MRRRLAAHSNDVRTSKPSASVAAEEPGRRCSQRSHKNRRGRKTATDPESIQNDSAADLMRGWPVSLAGEPSRCGGTRSRQLLATGSHRGVHGRVIRMQELPEAVMTPYGCPWNNPLNAAGASGSSRRTAVPARRVRIAASDAGQPRPRISSRSASPDGR